MHSTKILDTTKIGRCKPYEFYFLPSCNSRNFLNGILFFPNFQKKLIRCKILCTCFLFFIFLYKINKPLSKCNPLKLAKKMIMIYASETKKQIFPISCETIIPCKYQLGLLDCDFLECIRNVKKNKCINCTFFKNVSQ